RRDDLPAGLLDPRRAVPAADAVAVAAADPAGKGRGRRPAMARRHAWLRGSQEAARLGASFRLNPGSRPSGLISSAMAALSQSEIDALGARAEAMVNELGTISAEPYRLVRLF